MRQRRSLAAAHARIRELTAGATSSSRPSAAAPYRAVFETPSPGYTVSIIEPPLPASAFPAGRTGAGAAAGTVNHGVVFSGLAVMPHNPATHGGDSDAYAFATRGVHPAEASAPLLYRAGDVEGNDKF